MLYSGMLTAGLIDEKFLDGFADRGGSVERARAEADGAAGGGFQ